MVYYSKTVVKIHVLYLLHNINTLLQIKNSAKSQKIIKRTRTVNYDKSYIGVNVIKLIGNLVQKSEITTSE